MAGLDVACPGGGDGGATSCCRDGAREPHCLPILSPGHCQEYVRSLSSLQMGCHLGPREQMNLATSFLDGSGLYGTTKQSAHRLRSLSRGQLKLNSDGTLPRGDDTPCRSKESGCPLAADPRANSHSAISAIYALLAREHNRIAAQLSETNPHWGDERTYQETRRLIIAQLQHITFKEFVPAVLGQEVTKFFDLELLSAGFHQHYSMDEYPGVSNAAASTALKFYLALLPGYLQYINVNGEAEGEAPLSASFFAPFDLYKEGRLEQVLLGLTGSQASQGDSITEQLTDALGLDLAADTIQQARDHGVAAYTQWRQLCGLPPVTQFRDLNTTMAPSKIDMLRTMYRSPADIDLFVGGVLESPVEGAVVGPTFACLLGQQFQLVRQTDRFWFENEVPPSAFTKEQLYQIRKSSMARLFCNNIDGVRELPPNVFLKQDPFLNAPVLCDMLPFLDLSAWKSARSGVLIPDDVFGDVVSKAKMDLERRRNEERILTELKLNADPKSSLGTAYAFSRPNKQAVLLSNTSLILEYASGEFMSTVFSKSGNSRIKRQLVNLSNQLSGNPQTVQGFSTSLRQFDVSSLVSQVPIIDQCRADEETVPCDPAAPYRTYSGYCNNLANPNFGKSVTPQHRLLPAQYDDGISRPRQRSVTGVPLPSPRLISTTLHDDVSNPHSRYTMFLMQFGQFLDHDISMTPINKGFGDSILNCRDCDSANRVHPECWPISVPQNDPYFPPVNVSSGRPFCIAFTRSLPGQQTLGPREQINQNTAYLDASHIYGQDQCEARSLRQFQGGRLITTPHPVRGKGLLPTTRDNKECRAPSGSCFAAGDNRASEQAGLATLHVIWIREHNRVVAELASINPHWDDEKLYQVGRKIVTAVWEHITYNEFLPRILGWNAMQLYDLRVGTEGFFKGYDDTCSAAVLNEFSSAAFRFGHSLIRPKLFRMGVNFGERNPHIQLRNSFFNSDMLFDVQMVDEIMRGLVNTPMENLDNFITSEVTKHLFEERGHPFSGLDLVSLNIQRARDHGLRPYNEYRAICNLKKVTTFDELSREIPQRLINKMKQVYASVDDIDLFTGGLSETPLQGGLVGPTFGCIIGLQFRFLKKCDRFWYETEEPSIRFTEKQLAEIRKVTMSHIMCQNCDEVDALQRALFDMPHDFLNPRIACRSMPRMNFDLWKEGNNGGGQCNVNGVSFSRGTTISISPCTRCSCSNGQTNCQSVRVTSCQQLAQQHGRNTVLADTSCRVQCLSELGGGSAGASGGGSSGGARPSSGLSPPRPVAPAPAPVPAPVAPPQFQPPPPQQQQGGFQPAAPQFQPPPPPPPPQQPTRGRPFRGGGPFGGIGLGLQGLGRLFGL
ncbi:peroxidasin homolog pxn-1-like [Amphibalanus amphitrite]|uniref:peroxidasin homolog pxn-1-like n=1 Tax=Amphibalanus amphitrite TaxID=1232801 RepID=UPI001C91B848|nr:peroxidasin homolog pxn-1-like [Amphibalanus amphitrite]